MNATDLNVIAFRTDADAWYQARPVIGDEAEHYELACKQGFGNEVPTHIVTGMGSRIELAVRMDVTGSVERHIPRSDSMGYRGSFTTIDVGNGDQVTVTGWLRTS